MKFSTVPKQTKSYAEKIALVLVVETCYKEN